MSESSAAAYGISSIVNSLSRHANRMHSGKQHMREVHADRQAASEIGELRRDVGELKLYLATVISILIADKHLKPEEFSKVAELIDGLDGVEDGRFDGAITPEGGLDAMSADEDSVLRKLAKTVDDIAAEG